MSVRVGDEIVAGGQGDMYTKAQVDALIASAIAQTTEKPGMIKPFAGTTIPTGYLLCDGSAVSRTTYADLFAAIGTTYGAGDGNTTFNLPSFAARVPIGAGSVGSPYIGYVDNGQIPNLKTGGVIQTWHNNKSSAWTYGPVGSAATSGTAWSLTSNQGYMWTRPGYFDASIVSNVYLDGVTKVRPAGVGMYYVIKY